MDIQAINQQKPPTSFIQYPQPQQANQLAYKSVVLNPQNQPKIKIYIEPLQIHYNLCEEAKVKEQHSDKGTLQVKENQCSSVFSQSLPESSSEEQSHQNGTSKIKKVPKKSDRNGNYRKYSRITPEVKERLIHLIARQNMSIKQASLKIKINYSSAKFIFSQYRDRKLQIIDRDVDKGEIANDQVILQKIEQIQGQSINKKMKILIKCSSGGRFEAESEKVYALRELLQLYAQTIYVKSNTFKLEV